MEWLSQNWVWLAFAAGMVLMMRRGGAGACCGGHVAHDKAPHAEGSPGNSAATGGCCCGGGHGAPDKHPEAEEARNAAAGHQHGGTAQP